MVSLRTLRVEDSEYMMEFLNDPEISSNFKFTRYPFSKEGFIKFIERSWSDTTDVHFAVVEGEYAGTVSLKNISKIDRTAEYAIVIRKKFWGTGVAKDATDKIVQYGFNTLNIEKIYLNVFSSNARAISFYEKIGFVFEAKFKKHVFVDGKYEDLNWYSLFKNKEEIR